MTPSSFDDEDELTVSDLTGRIDVATDMLLEGLTRYESECRPLMADALYYLLEGEKRGEAS